MIMVMKLYYVNTNTGELLAEAHRTIKIQNTSVNDQGEARRESAPPRQETSTPLPQPPCSPC